MKNLYIAEKPSVANEFAKALKLNTKKKQGFLEADNAVVTWCVGHLVTMSYPESYPGSSTKDGRLTHCLFYQRYLSTRLLTL